MKNVLVTGSEGMLGSEVVRHLKRRSDVRVVRGTADSLDITNLAAVKQAFERHRPTHVVHCAAFTMVDTAEKEPLKAYTVNSEGTKNLAFFARELDAEFLYISTDYVFDGSKADAYVETDEPNPINVYGDSKLRGEHNVQTLCERHKIVRTSWLNGLGGVVNRNFIETMLRFSQTRDQLSVVNDQTGHVTFTFDLAPAIGLLLDVKSYGVYHVTGEGECTWYDLATKVFEIAQKSVTVKPISSDQFRSLARRPRHSVLRNTRFEGLGLPLLPHWEDSLREYFRRRRLAEGLRQPESRGPSRDAQYAS